MKRVAFAIALAVAVIDQLVKVWIRANLSIGEVLFQAGFFRIIRITNTGAAFGIFPSIPGLLMIFDIIGIIALSLIIIFSGRISLLKGRLELAALGLILGGTLGNFIYRVHLGSVTDFLDFTYWPVFNVADSAISIGALIFIYSFITQAFSKEA